MTAGFSFRSFAEPEAVAFAPSVLADYGVIETAAVVCDGILRLDDERFDAVVVRGQEAGTEASHVLAQRYRLADGTPEMLGNWVLRGTDASLLSPPAAPHETPPEPAVHAYACETVAGIVDWMRIGDDDSGIEVYDEDLPMASPSLYNRVDGQTRLNRFVMGNLAWAEGAARKILGESPDSDVAAFVYDDIATCNGQITRSFRLRVQQRGSAHSWVYSQPYLVPERGRRFEVSGELTLVRRRESLFP